jgi:hypothetical protein
MEDLWVRRICSAPRMPRACVFTCAPAQCVRCADARFLHARVRASASESAFLRLGAVQAARGLQADRALAIQAVWGVAHALGLDSGTAHVAVDVWDRFAGAPSCSSAFRSHRGGTVWPVACAWLAWKLASLEASEDSPDRLCLGDFAEAARVAPVALAWCERVLLTELDYAVERPPESAFSWLCVWITLAGAGAKRGAWALDAHALLDASTADPQTLVHAPPVRAWAALCVAYCRACNVTPTDAHIALRARACAHAYDLVPARGDPRVLAACQWMRTIDFETWKLEL